MRDYSALGLTHAVNPHKAHLPAVPDQLAPRAEAQLLLDGLLAHAIQAARRRREHCVRRGYVRHLTKQRRLASLARNQADDLAESPRTGALHSVAHKMHLHVCVAVSTMPHTDAWQERIHMSRASAAAGAATSYPAHTTPARAGLRAPVSRARTAQKSACARLPQNSQCQRWLCLTSSMARAERSCAHSYRRCMLAATAGGIAGASCTSTRRWSHPLNRLSSVGSPSEEPYATTRKSRTVSDVGVPVLLLDL